MHPRPKTRSVVLLASLSAAGACSAPPETASQLSAEHRVVQSVENGVPTLTNAGGPRFSGEILRYEKVVELQTRDDNPDSVLHFAEAFTMGPDGNFYVADTRRHRIAVFDADGRYARSIGREGDGPGDLRNPFDVRVVDDRLQVLGSRGHRLTIFELDGTFVDTVVHGEGTRPRAMYVAADGSRVVITAPFERRPGIQGYRAHAAVFDDEGGLAAEIETDWVQSAANVEVPGRGMFISPIQYAARPQAIFVPAPAGGGGVAGEILVSTGVEPVLVWHGLDGTPVRRVSIDLPPEPVTPAERDAIAADLDRKILDAPEESNERERILGKVELRVRRDNLVLEEPRAYWSFAAVDDRGFAWLRYAAPIEQDFYANQVHRFRLVDPEGVYLGDTTWPVMQGEGRVVGGHLLAMVFNEQTLQLVPTVFRIEPTIEELGF